MATRRARRPLNPAATRAADDQIYAAHAGDPRPNALYNADGSRRPLDAEDPAQGALRREWMDYYVAAGGALEGEPEPGRPAEPVVPCPNCTITSKTVATSPTNRARTKIGVGEEVELQVTPGVATWAITSGTGTLNPSSGIHSHVMFTADDNAGSVTITATTDAGCSCTITFDVVRPTHWTMKRKTGTQLKHTYLVMDCGWKGIMSLHPNDVNFYRVETREKDSQAVTTGCLNDRTGAWHGNYPLPDRVSAWFGHNSHTEAGGSRVAMEDSIYGGDPGPAHRGSLPPFIEGTLYFPITFQWRITGGARVHNFTSARQEHDKTMLGVTISRKGGNRESANWGDPTTDWS